jgi:hypothetical protein
VSDADAVLPVVVAVNSVVCETVDVGRKATSALQVAPGASASQLVATTWKSPCTASSIAPLVDAPVFAIVNLIAGLVSPTVTEPKSAVSGESARAGGPSGVSMGAASAGVLPSSTAWLSPPQPAASKPASANETQLTNDLDMVTRNSNGRARRIRW